MNANNIFLNNSLLKETENKNKNTIPKTLIDIVNNWEDYIEKYKDLKENGIDTIYSAFEHYIKFGKNEGRILKVNPLNINLINDTFTKSYQYDYIKLYEEYDWDKYIKIYKLKEYNILSILKKFILKKVCIFVIFKLLCSKKIIFKNLI